MARRFVPNLDGFAQVVDDGISLIAAGSAKIRAALLVCLDLLGGRFVRFQPGLQRRHIDNVPRFRPGDVGWLSFGRSSPPHTGRAPCFLPVGAMMQPNPSRYGKSPARVRGKGPLFGDFARVTAAPALLSHPHELTEDRERPLPTEPTGRLRWKHGDRPAQASTDPSSIRRHYGVWPKAVTRVRVTPS